jgi:dynein heavy chain
LNNAGFIGSLKDFDRDNVEESLILNLGKFLNSEENKTLLSLESVKSASKACECIIMWVNGIYNYYFVNKKIKPKKAMLAEAQGKADVLNKKLAIEQAKLKQATDKVKLLNNDLK